MAVMTSGLATSNEGDAYTWSVICCLILNEFTIFNIYIAYSVEKTLPVPWLG
jgi:hypothetical protein